MRQKAVSVRLQQQQQQSVPIPVHGISISWLSLAEIDSLCSSATKESTRADHRGSSARTPHCAGTRDGTLLSTATDGHALLAILSPSGGPDRPNSNRLRIIWASDAKRRPPGMLADATLRRKTDGVPHSAPTVTTTVVCHSAMRAFARGTRRRRRILMSPLIPRMRDRRPRPRPRPNICCATSSVGLRLQGPHTRRCRSSSAVLFNVPGVEASFALSLSMQLPFESWALPPPTR